MGRGGIKGRLGVFQKNIQFGKSSHPLGQVHSRRTKVWVRSHMLQVAAGWGLRTGGLPLSLSGCRPGCRCYTQQLHLLLRQQHRRWRKTYNTQLMTANQQGGLGSFSRWHHVESLTALETKQTVTSWTDHYSCWKKEQEEWRRMLAKNVKSLKSE